tara:strand:- start:2860 stop:3714 length:855 start_codon:yes stop_codon:yes gene_type:complete
MIVLDGSMGNELLKRAKKPATGLWSAQFLIDAPELVKEVHQDYISAGANIITTNTYSTIPSYLSKENKTHLMGELIERAGKIARKVVNNSKQEVLVAGSLPPLDESYRPDLVQDISKSIPIYKEIISKLNPYIDFYLCETISSLQETSNVLNALLDRPEPKKPIWLSWTLLEDKNSLLRSGESIRKVFEFAESFKPEVYLFNCTNPEAITEGIKVLRKLTNKPIGGYPNVFDVPHDWTLDNEIDITPNNLSINKFKKYAYEWESLGASIIGGCCGIGPEYIKAI